MVPGHKVLLDQGAQFTVADDGKLATLNVYTESNSLVRLGIDALGSASGGVFLPSGLVTNGEVWVGGHRIGVLTSARPDDIKVSFDDAALLTEVETLVHALTATIDGAFTSGPIFVDIADTGGLVANSGVSFLQR